MSPFNSPLTPAFAPPHRPTAPQGRITPPQSPVISTEANSLTVRVAERPLYLALLLLCTLCPIPLRAQLPAGTTDATQQRPSTPDDQLRADAADALEQRNYPAALKALRALSEAHPDDPRILFDLASTQDALDQISPAETNYRRSIAADPSYLEPHLALGLMLARNARPADARTELVAATTLQKGDPLLRAQSFRALAHLDERSNPAEARDALLAALSLSPETPDDTLLSATLAEAAGDLPAADAADRRILAAHPDDPSASTALAHILVLEKKPAEAEALLSKTAAAHPDDPAAAAGLAGLLARTGQLEKAVDLITPVHAAHPEDADITRLYAHLLAARGDYSAAEPLLAQLRRQSPADPVAADEDADALIRLQRPAEAEALLQAALARPDAFPTRDRMAEAASHLSFAASANNDPQTVLQALTLRATVLPQTAATLFLQAAALDKLHQTKQAQALYRQFLSVASGKFPNEEWEARHRLLALEHMK